MAADEWQDMKRENVWLRALFMGPNGAGKTKGALEVATKLAVKLGGIPVVLLDTQHGQAKLYSDEYAAKYSQLVGDFSPESYMAKIDSAEKAFPGGILIIDGITQEWNGKGGVQTLVDRFGGWKEATPRHNEFIERMLALQMHLICTCRMKMKFEVTEVPRDGGGVRQNVRKLGLGPEQREQIMYEFDIIATIDQEHEATFSNRCEPLTDTSRSLLPGDEVAEIIASWLSEGDPPAPVPEATPEAVQELVESLAEEKITEEKIEEKFAIARRTNSGKLHPDYVAEQLDKSQKRLAAKQQREGAPAAA